MPYKLSVGVDPRIELLSAIELLAGWNRIKHYWYTHEMAEYLRPYSNHPAVRLFRELNAFRSDAAVRFVLCLSSPPLLSYETKPPADIVQRAKNLENLESFRKLLISFYEDTNFSEFLHKNSAFYSTIKKKTEGVLKGDETIRRFEDYYGVKYDNYYVILSPATAHGNYGGDVGAKEKKISAILCVSDMDANLPRFQTQVLFHEFSHSVINPITDELLEKTLKNGKTLFDKVKEPMNKMNYNNLETIITETIIRACDIKVNEHKWVGSALDREQGQGFLYIKPVFEILTEYESNRGRYKTFEDFYPKIVLLLGSIAV